MGGAVRKATGAPNRKDTAEAMKRASAEATPIEPEKEVAAPTIDDAAGAAQEELKKNKKQQGRASTIFGSADTQQTAGNTAKATLGA